MGAEVTMLRILFLTVLIALVASCSSVPPPPPPPPPGSTEPAPPPPRRVFIGDVRTKQFHREGCPELEGVDISYQRLLEDPGEAADKHFEPCRRCRPFEGW
jgi:hypothetical protein